MKNNREEMLNTHSKVIEHFNVRCLSEIIKYLNYILYYTSLKSLKTHFLIGSTYRELWCMYILLYNILI